MGMGGAKLMPVELFYRCVTTATVISRWSRLVSRVEPTMEQPGAWCLVAVPGLGFFSLPLVGNKFSQPFALGDGSVVKLYEDPLRPSK